MKEKGITGITPSLMKAVINNHQDSFGSFYDQSWSNRRLFDFGPAKEESFKKARRLINIFV